jgi:hypothetical protein
VLCTGITYYVACLCLLSNKLKKIVHAWLAGIHQTDYRSIIVIALTYDEKSNFNHSCDNNNDDVPELFLPDGKFNVTGIHWLTSHIEDGLNLNLFPRLKAEFRKMVYENNMTPADKSFKASKQQASVETQ